MIESRREACAARRTPEVPRLPAHVLRRTGGTGKGGLDNAQTLQYSKPTAAISCCMQLTGWIAMCLKGNGSSCILSRGTNFGDYQKQSGSSSTFNTKQLGGPVVHGKRENKRLLEERLVDEPSLGGSVSILVYPWLGPWLPGADGRRDHGQRGQKWSAGLPTARDF